MKYSSFDDLLNSFLLDSNRDKFVDLLNHHEGETNLFDFKSQWPDKVDLAKDILAFANSGGGCIVIGVAEDSNTKKVLLQGLSPENIQDKSVITSKYENYLPKNLLQYVEIKDYDFKNSTHTEVSDKFFSAVIIQNCPIGVPYMTLKSSDKKLVQGRIYIRRGTKTVEADTEEINQLLERKFKYQYSHEKTLDLDAHLKQLKTLYSSLPTTNPILSPIVRDIFNARSNYHAGYVEFLKELIEKKKKRIEIELNITDN